MKKYVILIGFYLLFPIYHVIGQTSITVENIWRDYTFYSGGVDDFKFQKDGKHFTRLVNGQIIQFAINTGLQTAVLFDLSTIDNFNEGIDDYFFSDDERKVLLQTGTERIYRHSTRANFYVWDLDKKGLSVLEKGQKQRYATFNPQGTRIAFVRGNNLFFKDLSTGIITQITADGKQNAIINGATDWVYEEEFSFAKAFEWSPDGEKIAFLRFDESAVPEFTFQQYHRDELYPENVTFKYPKVGQNNAIVSAHIYNIQSKKSVPVQLDNSKEFYIPRIKWTNDPGKLCVLKMNRHQNKLELFLADAKSGKTNILLKEKNDFYIDIHDNLTFLKDNEHFIWTSENDGWNHIYLYDLHGKKVKQLTKGKWEVTAFYGVDEKNQVIYYQSTEESPLERHIYKKSIAGRKKENLTPRKGWHTAQFSNTFDFFIHTYSTINTPPIYEVRDNAGTQVRLIKDNQQTIAHQQHYNTTPVEFFDFKTADDVTLHGYMIKPPHFDKTKQYPVFMYLYGGPGSQEVVDRWKGQFYWWFQMLAQKGYIVAVVDNRGTGGRGEAFKKMTYMQLGKFETIDQINAAKHLGSLPYTDASRIGIFGWSYGGYLSSLAILKGNDVFKAAIAVAPVTNWKWYDSIYTERYMRTEEENPEGYSDNSPVNFAGKLKGNYLIIHGMGDDNVHFQNTVEMADALIEVNKQFDTYFYPNKNHGIYGGYTRLHLFNKMTNFILEKL